MMDMQNPDRSHFSEYEKTCSFTTTGQFQHLAGGFTAHCGPVAVTNVILTYWKRHGRPDLDPNEVFLKAASYGSSHLLYANRQIFGAFGGTSDTLSGVYLRNMLHEFGIYDLKVSPAFPSVPALVRKALSDGSIVYLQLAHHPKYKNHHLIAYGTDGDGKNTKYIAADAWVHHPTVLSGRDLVPGTFRIISGF